MIGVHAWQKIYKADSTGAINTEDTVADPGVTLRTQDDVLNIVIKENPTKGEEAAMAPFEDCASPYLLDEAIRFDGNDSLAIVFKLRQDLLTCSIITRAPFYIKGIYSLTEEHRTDALKYLGFGQWTEKDAGKFVIEFDVWFEPKFNIALERLISCEDGNRETYRSFSQKLKHDTDNIRSPCQTARSFRINGRFRWYLD